VLISASDFPLYFSLTPAFRVYYLFAKRHLDRKALVYICGTADIIRAAEIIRAIEIIRGWRRAFRRIGVIKVFAFIAI